MCFREWIAYQHYQPTGWFSRLLWPASVGYGFGVAVRQKIYEWGWLQAISVAVPVISIGNLTTGGTGKTPMVVAMAKQLVAAGKRVVVLSRGYGATQPMVYGVPAGPEHGDEPWLICCSVPEATVIVGRNRAHNARQAIQDYHPDVILLDDGYQYLPLARSWNVLLVDGQRLFGNGCLLPAGPLREPLSAMARADVILLTKSTSEAARQQVQSWLSERGLLCPVVEVPFHLTGFLPLDSSGLVPPADLSQVSGVALSGIADPVQFEKTLSDSGIKITHHLRRPDHHIYNKADVRQVVDAVAAGQVVFTTEKDRVKLLPVLPEAVKSSVYSVMLSPQIPVEGFPPEFREMAASVSAMECL